MTNIVNADGQSWPCHSVAMPIDIGTVRGTTRNVGVDHVVFTSPVPFAVGSAISFVISTATEIRFECSGTVTDDLALLIASVAGTATAVQRRKKHSKAQP